MEPQMSPELFVYLDIEGVKHYLVHSRVLQADGTVVWQRQVGQTPMDMTAHRKPRAPKYYFGFKELPLTEVTLKGPEEFQGFAKVMFPQDFVSGRILCPTGDIEYEVDLPSCTEGYYAIGKMLAEHKSATVKGAILRMLGVKHKTDNKEYRSHHEQRLDLSEEQLTRLVASELVGVNEAAEILKLSVRRVHKLAKEGRIGICVEGRYVFPKSELEHFKNLKRKSGVNLKKK